MHTLRPTPRARERAATAAAQHLVADHRAERADHERARALERDVARERERRQLGRERNALRTAAQARERLLVGPLDSSPSAPILTDSQNNCANFIHIAATELKQGMLDIIIQRPLPMGKSYEVNIKDLDPPDDLDAIVSLFSDNSVAR